MADRILVASPDRPKLVIDFPFDDAGRSPKNDLERLDNWSQRHGPTTAVCWLPSFFNSQGLSILGRYVAIDELFKHDRFNQYTSHLSKNERIEAKPILESLHRQLAAQLNVAILCAYGVVTNDDPLVDPTNSLTDHYRSLDPSLVIRPTTRPTLNGALNELCDQILIHLYPGHPDFHARITPGHLRTTWEETRRALADPDGRINVEASKRKILRNIANHLRLGTMYEAHFILGDFWRTQLDRYLNDAAGSATVTQIRAWIDAAPGGPRGLEHRVADLVIMTVAAQTDHRLTLHGSTYSSEAGKAMPGDVVFIPEQLPPPDRWNRAVERAAVLFGVRFQHRLTGPELISMAVQIRDRAAELNSSVTDLVAELSNAYTTWNLRDGNRLATARATHHLIGELQDAGDSDIVELLANFAAPTSDRAAAKSLKTAQRVADHLRQANLRLWKSARPVVEQDVNEALTVDEFVMGFGPAKERIEEATTNYITSIASIQHTSTDRERDRKTVPDIPSRPGDNRTANQDTVQSSQDVERLASRLREALAEGRTIEVYWSLSDPH